MKIGDRGKLRKKNTPINGFNEISSNFTLLYIFEDQ